MVPLSRPLQCRDFVGSSLLVDLWILQRIPVQDGWSFLFHNSVEQFRLHQADLISRIRAARG